MPTVAVNNLRWGPLAGGNALTGGSSVATMSDADNSLATLFRVPVLGAGVTLSHVGICVTNKTGTPPQYNFGLVTTTSGNPTTTPYGSSEITAFAPTGNGALWVPLTTPATPTTGDWIAARVYPTASAPDGANFVAANYYTVMASRGAKTSAFVASWTANSAYGVGVKASDGTIIQPLLTASTTANVNTGTTPDEVGGLFSLPFDCTCIGAEAMVTPGNTSADFTLKLYSSGNDLLGSQVVDVSEVDAGAAAIFHARWATVTLKANTNYRLTVLPGSANSLTVAVGTADAAAGRGMWSEGANWQGTSRSDAGEWSNTATQIPMLGLVLSSLTMNDGGGGRGFNTTHM